MDEYDEMFLERSNFYENAYYSNPLIVDKRAIQVTYARMIASLGDEEDKDVLVLKRK